MGSLCVHDHGRGLPVVWVHGFPLSSRMFEQQFGLPGVRHLAPDLPGFGGSAPAPIEGIDDYGTLVASMLHERGIDRAVFAGVSMGGYVAFSIARDHPDLVAGLILVDTRETPDSDEGRANRLAQIERVDREGTSFLIDEMMPRMLTDETRHRNDRRTDLVREAMWSASAAGVRRALRAMAGRPDSTAVLRSCDLPVLVVVGACDELTPPSDAARMASLAKHSTLVEIAAAAHLSNVEQPETFNASVSAFLGRLR